MHKPPFKANVALTATIGEKSMAYLVYKFDVQAVPIIQWEKQLMASVGEEFDNSEKATEDNEQTVLELRTKIGQLTMEVEYFEKGLRKIHDPKGEKR